VVARVGPLIGPGRGHVAEVEAPARPRSTWSGAKNRVRTPRSYGCSLLAFLVVQGADAVEAGW
jgi:hypothetical protein